MNRNITYCIFLLLLAGTMNGQNLIQQKPSEKRQHLIDIHTQEIGKRLNDTSYHKSILPTIPIEGITDGTLHFPYPIVFIHGLGSSADTWTNFYTEAITSGWSYGGQLRYHLNLDLNNQYANIYDPEVQELGKFQNDVAVGDFYLINFNVSTDGEPLGEEPNYYLSNQAAIVKQGIALADAIATVKRACGVDKVILFGHSMGGLASREYFQNPENWVDPNHHSVAKLYSTSGFQTTESS